MTPGEHERVLCWDCAKAVLLATAQGGGLLLLLARSEELPHTQARAAGHSQMTGSAV